MKKRDLFIVALAIILGLGFGYFIFRSSPKEVIIEKVIEDTQKIDSLSSIIKENEVLIKSFKDSVREKIVYIEKKVDEIKELPLDDNLEIFRNNLSTYGENSNLEDTLPSLCQLEGSSDTLILMSEGNLIDVNTIYIRYSGTLEINNYYRETIKADSSIISLKNSIIQEKNDIIDRERENFESNMKDMEKIINKERRKQIYYTVGGIVVAGALTYLILK